MAYGLISGIKKPLAGLAGKPLAARFTKLYLRASQINTLLWIILIKVIRFYSDAVVAHSSNHRDILSCYDPIFLLPNIAR